MSSATFDDEVGAETSSDERGADLQSILGDDGDADEMLDTSYSPPEREPHNPFDSETFDQRLADESPEVWAGAEDGDGIGDQPDSEGELRDREVGDARAGRLCAGSYGDDVFADDCGVDGGAATAEEAAMHIVSEDDDGALND